MLQKQGEKPTDCQDAASALDQCGRFAVSDGATESYLPREWAEILCTFASKNGIPSPDQDLESWLSAPQKEWRERRDALLNDPSVPWWQQDPTRKAAATLVALELDMTLQGTSFSWTGMAIGDSCAFLVRNRTLIDKFPCQNRADFGQSPDCFFSVPVALSYQPIWKGGQGQAGDVILLATDALAEWIFRRMDEAAPPWDRLLSLKNLEDLAHFVEEERTQGRMRNDDVTLLVVWTATADQRRGQGPAPAPLLVVDEPAEETLKGGETDQSEPKIPRSIQFEDKSFLVLAMVVGLAFLALIILLRWYTRSNRHPLAGVETRAHPASIEPTRLTLVIGSLPQLGLAVWKPVSQPG